MSNTNYMEENRLNTRIIKRVAFVSLACNIVLAAAKTTLGAIFSNVSVLSDAVHTVSDVGITLLVLLSAFICKPNEDKKYNYGHEKVEPLLVLLFAAILTTVGVMFIIEGIEGIIKPQEVTRNNYLLGVTVLSIVAKEAMYWYTIFYAKKTRSNALKADAWHQRADGLSSVAVLIGLVCSSFMKNDLAESIAVLLVAGLIIKIALQIFISSVNQLIDKAADESTCGDLRQIIAETAGVISIDKLQTRLFGGAIYVDVEIGVDGNLTVKESHKIAQSIQDKLEQQQKFRVKHCNVHINPAKSSECKID